MFTHTKTNIAFLKFEKLEYDSRPMLSRTWSHGYLSVLLIQSQFCAFLNVISENYVGRGTVLILSIILIHLKQGTCNVH